MQKRTELLVVVVSKQKYTIKKVVDFLIPRRDTVSLTKLSPAGANLIIPGQRKFT